jgi:CHAD domain-containing protein
VTNGARRTSGPTSPTGTDVKSNEPIPHEREAKVSVWPGFRLPELRERIPWVVTGEPEEQVLDARYYDAADLRLIRLGITLRHRTGEGDDAGRWTLKLPQPSEGLELDRLEMEEVGPADAPPEHMVRAVKGVLRGAALVPVAHLQTQRKVIPIHDPAQRPLGSLDDDVVTAFEGDEVGLRFREVEIELAPGAPASLISAVVGALRAAGAGAPDHTPKLARALGPRAAAPADPAVPALSRDASTAVVFQNAVAGSVRRLLLHDPIVRLDAGEEGVHQARVATRRLRSDLRTFRPLLLADRVEPVRDELAWLGDLLGGVRDADVLRRRLAGEVEELDEEDREAGGKLLAVLDGQRAPRLAALHEALDSARYVALIETLVDLALTPPLLAEAGEPARTTLPKLAATPWKHLGRNIAGLPKHPSDEELHRVRILAKRARYAAEAAAPVLPAAGKHAAAIAELQGILGDHQDAVVGESWLRAVTRDGCGGAEAFAAGLLVSRERSAASRYRGRWRAIWDAANQKKLRAWLLGAH